MDLERKKELLTHLYLRAQVPLPLFSQKEEGLYRVSTFKDSLELFSYLSTVRGGPQSEEDQGVAVELALKAVQG